MEDVGVINCIAGQFVWRNQTLNSRLKYVLALQDSFDMRAIGPARIEAHGPSDLGNTFPFMGGMVCSFLAVSSCILFALRDSQLVRLNLSGLDPKGHL